MQQRHFFAFSLPQRNAGHNSAPIIPSPLSKQDKEKEREPHTETDDVLESTEDITEDDCKSLIDPSIDLSTTIVRLNIGGHKYVTTAVRLRHWLYKAITQFGQIHIEGAREEKEAQRGKERGITRLDATSAGERGRRLILTDPQKTLTQNGTADNFFTALISDKFTPLKDDEGFYFVDRDGSYFRPILGRTPLPPRAILQTPTSLAL